MRETRERLAQGAIAGTLGVGPRGAVGGGPRDHRTRVAFLDLLGGALPVLEEMTGLVEDHGIAHRREPQEQIAPVRIDRDHAFVAANQRPGERVTAALGPDPSQRVSAGQLDLDDVGAEVGEDGGDRRTREQCREIEDVQASEGAVRHAPRLGSGARSRPSWGGRSREGSRARRTR